MANVVEIAMPPRPTPLREDYDAVKVREAARKSQDGSQVRRLLTLASIYEGASRSQAARLGGVTVQVVRDWVVRFNTDGPDGLIDRKGSGRPSKLSPAHRAALAAAIESGPIPAIHGVVRWRLIDLMQWLWDEFSVSVSKPTLSHIVRAMGYRKLSARPRHHAQKPGAIEGFKKVSQTSWRRSRAKRSSMSP